MSESEDVVAEENVGGIVTTETTEEEEEVAEEEPEEEVEEEEEEEECEDVKETVAIGTSTTFQDKTIKVKLSSSSAVQLSVGGKTALLSLDEKDEINGIEILVLNADDEEALLKFYCPE